MLGFAKPLTASAAAATIALCGGGGMVNAQCSYEIDVEGASSVRTNCGAVVSAPSAPVSDTSLEFGFGVNLLLGNQFLLRTEATFFDFDVYSGARFGLGAGMRF